MAWLEQVEETDLTGLDCPAELLGERPSPALYQTFMSRQACPERDVRLGTLPFYCYWACPVVGPAWRLANMFTSCQAKTHFHCHFLADPTPGPVDKPTPRARQTWEVGAKPALSFHLTISRDKPSQEGNTSAKPTKSDSVTSPSQAKLHGEATAKLNLAQD